MKLHRSPAAGIHIRLPTHHSRWLILTIGALCLGAVPSSSRIDWQQEKSFVARSVESEKPILSIYVNAPRDRGEQAALNQVGYFVPLVGMLSMGSGDFVIEREGSEAIQGDQISDFSFSPDLTRHAFAFRRTGMTNRMGGEVFLVLDDRISDSYSFIARGTFSPDGKMFSYVGLRPLKVGFSKKKWFDLVVGDQKLGPYEGASPASFSADGTCTSYAFQQNKVWIAVQNGQQTSARYEELSVHGCTPSGVVVGGRRNGQWVVDIGGRSYPQKARPVNVGYRASSKAPIVVLQTDKERWMVSSEDSTFGPFQSLPKLVVSPKSGDFQFVGQDKGGYWVNTGGSNRGPYQSVKGIALGSQPGDWAYGAQTGSQFKLFTPEGERGPWLDMAGPFGGNSGLIYAYKSEAGWFVRTPSDTFGPYRQVAGLPQFWRESPDSRRFAFAAADQTGWSVIIDGQAGKVSGVDIIAMSWLDATSIRYVIAKDPGSNKQNHRHRQAWYLVEERLK